MATRQWNADDDALITRLQSDGATLTAAARQMERSKATVSRHAARLGLSWDRTQTSAATVAKVKDAAARRADAVRRRCRKSGHSRSPRPPPRRTACSQPSRPPSTPACTR